MILKSNSHLHSRDSQLTFDVFGAKLEYLIRIFK